MLKLFNILLLSGCLLLSACNTLNTRSPVLDDDFESLQQKADTAYAAEQWQTAADNYQLLIEQDQQDAEIWYRLGNSRAELGEMEQAITALKTATEMEPENIEAWHNLGILYLRNATSTFFELQQHTEPHHPLAKRGRFVINSVGEILRQGYGITVNREAKTE